MNLKRKRILGASIALAALGGAALPASSAVAYISPPLVLLAQPLSPAHLVAGGAAIDVPVNYTCTAKPDGMYLTLDVTEAAGRKIAGGSASQVVPCNGRSTTIVMRVNAVASGAPFAKGTASTVTHVYGYLVQNNRYYSGDDVFTGTVKIVK